MEEETEKLEDKKAEVKVLERERQRENQSDQNEEDLFKKIEAVLFLASRFLSIDEIVMFTGINPIMARELLEKLEQRYSSSGLAIVKRKGEFGELYKMDIKQEFSYLVNKLATGKTEFSRAEQETLAVIAYKKPIKQSIVVKIRGNKAYDHIKHFIEVGLVKARKLGRTLELDLSDNFYDYFKIKKPK